MRRERKERDIEAIRWVDGVKYDRKLFLTYLKQITSLMFLLYWNIKKIINDKLTNEEYYKTLRETCEYLYQIMSHLRYKTETARRASIWWPSRKLSSFKHSPKLSFLVRFSGALFPGISINMRKSWKLYKSKAIQLDFYDWIVIWHWYNDVW